jgi:uncharacterized protein YbgA (DUF1722 family)
MRRKQMRRNELPDTCLSTLSSTGQLIVLKHGVRGYYRSEWDTGNRAENRDIAERYRQSAALASQTAITGGAALRIFRKLP